eukprot:CAMPEP_0115142056 /NCGR_PEP_ID=MMETSP0227-20121206/59923_1 /TAXON_ID=89957 /ORGANISM="Polarella glacialis, Strain CCMP 1383" /LENGTH=95 /DNA_ID=CAMNT_0002550571 /DNA_START=346 /DNA_END=633 /DNA_ORIENTATION=+
MTRMRRIGRPHPSIGPTLSAALSLYERVQGRRGAQRGDDDANYAHRAQHCENAVDRLTPFFAPPASHALALLSAAAALVLQSRISVRVAPKAGTF